MDPSNPEVTHTEVLIIGAGVSGLSCALALLDAGRRVHVIDRGLVGSGASHGNCGLITPSHAMPLGQPGMVWQALKWMLRKDAPVYIKPRLSLEFLHWGWRFARACGTQRMLEIAQARANILNHSRDLFPAWLEKHGIECEWETGGQLLALATEAGAEHEFSLHAGLGELGIDVSQLSPSELVQLEPCLRPGLVGGAHYPGDAQLRPEKLVSEMARAVREESGGSIEEGLAAQEFIEQGPELKGVVTARGEIKADEIILASGAWAPSLGQKLGLDVPIQAGRGYSITMQRTEPCPRIPLILEEAAMGVTPWASGLRLAGSMEFSGLHSTPSPERFRALRDGARRFLTLEPGEKGGEEWTGYRAMTPDELPMVGGVGRFSNLYLATGHGRMGVGMSPSTGQLIAAEICGVAPPIDPAPYSPKRFARNA